MKIINKYVELEVVKDFNPLITFKDSNTSVECTMDELEQLYYHLECIFGL